MRYSHRPSQSSKRHLVIDGLAARFPLASCATAKAAEVIVDALNRVAECPGMADPATAISAGSGLDPGRTQNDLEEIA